jgi:hypothetical protein
LPSSSQGLTYDVVNNAIAMTGNSGGGSPYVHAYSFSGSGFGTKYADPGTPLTGEGTKSSFRPAGDAVAFAHVTSPRITAYPWSSSGFGTKYSNPATLPTNTGLGVSFHPSENFVAFSVVENTSSLFCNNLIHFVNPTFSFNFGNPG